VTNTPAKSPQGIEKEIPMRVVVDRVGQVMRAIHEFEAVQKGDLGLKIGDIVTITRIGLKHLTIS
jgi:hypothetical protein